VARTSNRTTYKENTVNKGDIVAPDEIILGVLMADKNDDAYLLARVVYVPELPSVSGKVCIPIPRLDRVTTGMKVGQYVLAKVLYDGGACLKVCILRACGPLRTNNLRKYYKQECEAYELTKPVDETTCPICRLECTSVMSLVQHMANSHDCKRDGTAVHHDRECEYCGRMCGSPAGLAAHIRAAHSSDTAEPEPPEPESPEPEPPEPEPSLEHVTYKDVQEAMAALEMEQQLKAQSSVNSRPTSSTGVDIDADELGAVLNGMDGRALGCSGIVSVQNNMVHIQLPLSVRDSESGKSTVIAGTRGAKGTTLSVCGKRLYISAAAYIRG
jgi:hypothetical protein